MEDTSVIDNGVMSLHDWLILRQREEFRKSAIFSTSKSQRWPAHGKTATAQACKAKKFMATVCTRIRAHLEFQWTKLPHKTKPMIQDRRRWNTKAWHLDKSLWQQHLSLTSPNLLFSLQEQLRKALKWRLSSHQESYSIGTTKVLLQVGKR